MIRNLTFKSFSRLTLLMFCVVIFDFNFLLVTALMSKNIEKPHIVFIVADDLGWNDVSYHGSNQIMTPNIDVLAYKGIVLQQYYTDSQGTSSRSSLFTGKYSFRLGTQGDSISSAEDRGIPLSERLLPSYLKELGYSTHLVGKWSLGKSRESYLPTNRGFEAFYGFLGSSVDYYTYNHVEIINETEYFGLDLFNNLEPVEQKTGHLTELLTDRAIEVIRQHDMSTPLYLHLSHAAPHTGGGGVNLQPPEEFITANNHIAHNGRRLYAGSVTDLDRSVGHIIAALAEKEILENTLVIFVSDNGAPTTGITKNYGSNLPFRGTKGTPLEGALRSLAIIWHNNFQSNLYTGLFHVTDWLPTLVSVAGGNVTNNIDGVNQWNTILKGIKSERHNIITFDDLNGWATARNGDFKIIIGSIDKDKTKYYSNELRGARLPEPSYERMLFNSETAHVLQKFLGITLDIDDVCIKRKKCTIQALRNHTSEMELCIPDNAKGCLFNVSADPLEANDLWLISPEIVQRMILELRFAWSKITPRSQPQLDNRANPALYDYIWFPWLNQDEELQEPLKTKPPFPLSVSIEEMKYLVDSNLNAFKQQLDTYVQQMTDSFIKSVSEIFSF